MPPQESMREVMGKGPVMVVWLAGRRIVSKGCAGSRIKSEMRGSRRPIASMNATGGEAAVVERDVEERSRVRS
jgi:hypothetical protein